MKKSKPTAEKARLQCTFHLPENHEAFGELHLKGQNSRLRLSSNSRLPFFKDEFHLNGTTLDGYKVSCIDCIATSQGSNTWVKESVSTYHARIFPHYVTVGREHLDPSTPVVRSIHFTVTDIESLFYDFDAFGHVLGAAPLMDQLLADRRAVRPVEVGEYPEIAYFTGKMTVIRVATKIGEVTVGHRPSFSNGGPGGACIKNRMMISLEPPSPTTFNSALAGVMTLARFLSVIAGREQAIKRISIATTTADEDWGPMRVHWSHAPRVSRTNTAYLTPHPGDVPLDPITRPAELSNVLQNWLAREDGWRMARARYLTGIGKGTSYDADRLVRAANMFDILPLDGGLKPSTLPEALAAARTQCLSLLKDQPPCQDRDSAISAISRMGKPSLPKKVQHHTALVVARLGSRFAEIPTAIKVAVSCRNYFVHGGSDDFDFRPFESFMPFLTDALEFIFCASDLIEAGWDAERLGKEPYGRGHNFTRFLDKYRAAMPELLQTLAAVKAMRSADDTDGRCGV